MAGTGKVVLGSCLPVYGNWRDRNFWHVRDMSLIVLYAFPNSSCLLHLPTLTEAFGHAANLGFEANFWNFLGNSELMSEWGPFLYLGNAVGQLRIMLLQSFKGTVIAWPRTVSSWLSMEKSGRKQLVEFELYSRSAGMGQGLCVIFF